MRVLMRTSWLVSPSPCARQVLHIILWHKMVYIFLMMMLIFLLELAWNMFSSHTSSAGLFLLALVCTCRYHCFHLHCAGSCCSRHFLCMHADLLIVFTTRRILWITLDFLHSSTHHDWQTARSASLTLVCREACGRPSRSSPSMWWRAGTAPQRSLLGQTTHSS
jgi:hypothetical protein